MRFGEFGCVTAREKPSHRRGNGRTHHRPMFPPAAPSSRRWWQSSEGRVSSFLSSNVTTREVSWTCALHCCHLGFPVGAHWTRSELSCRLWSLQVSSLCCPLPERDFGMTFTLSSLKVECHRLKDPAHCSAGCPSLSVHLFVSVPPPFIKATVSTTIVLILGNIVASPPH